MMTAKKIITALGVVFVIVGILGFFQNPVLGLFAVDEIHNIIHLASGLLALVMASRGEASAKLYAQIFGIVYALVTVLGFLWPNNEVLGLITINGNDDFLHLFLAIVLLYVGFRRDGVATATNHTA